MQKMKEVSELIAEVSPFYAGRKKKKLDVPAQEHKLVYDSASETLEPVYFWILDKMNDFFQGEVEKYVDNFVSSPARG